ncbi:MAG: hypothetical protein AAGJ40_21170 [Planctomycetota bacterium]
MTSHKRRDLVAFLSTAMLLLCTCKQSEGALVVDVSGQPGSGETTWAFSGQFDVQLGVATGGLPGGLTPTSPVIPFLWSVDSFFLPKTGNPSAAIGFLPGGTASFTGTITGTELIGGIDLGEGGATDLFGIFGSGGLVVAGETLTFSGESQVPFGIEFFDEASTFPTTFSGTSPLSAGISVPIEITLNSTAVPEPSTAMVVMFIGLISLMQRWHRNSLPQHTI